ncbi:hypothetical protein [Saccharolobus islandicus]|uniref:Uncharacterized protein n=1 Tax=Saccharolobus islandicus (strain REY15A) TaxID=930945 RepID=F0NCX7_SACI5|nr:hypothetical protein [Sulfolobus islandicus]ADX86199.1 conserved hypothetical protein [Sulfolobus islandicus REY15A]
MNKLLLLGVLLSTILVGGVVIGEEISGSLGTISYNVTSPTIQTTLASFNLGNLTAGQKGTLTENATLTVSANGTYTIKLKEDVLGDVFSEFNVTIHIANYTFTLSLHGTEHYTLYLSKGTYTVNIKISYVVSQNPEAKSVSNIPFLIVKYGGEQQAQQTQTAEHGKKHHDDDNEQDD